MAWRAPVFRENHQSRLTLPMNDGTGDSLSARLDLPHEEAGLPLLILIHGLTGSEDSRNITVSAAYFASLGFPVLRLNLRGAGPSEGLCKQHYHAGRSQDLAAALSALPASLKEHGVAMAGVSLGGNALLKFAAEVGSSTELRAVSSVCAPIDLKAAQQRIMAPRNGIYHRHLLKHMKAGAYQAAQSKGTQDKDTMATTLKQVNSVYAYDDLIVAPQNGFAGAEDYYAKCSAGPMLSGIQTPTLLIHAKTDPWIPTSMYTDQPWPGNGPLSLVISDDGGHVGFHGRGDTVPWHDRCIGQFFMDVAKR